MPIGGGMLLIKTKLSHSSIHGIGLFADEDIPMGTPIWKYHPSTCNVLSPTSFYELCTSIPVIAIKNFINYSYIRSDRIYYINDNTRFINHALDANIAFIDDFTEVATKDIAQGEELLENYYASYGPQDFFCLDKLFTIECKQELLSILGDICAQSKNIPCPVEC